jgi:hypothetical protein
MKIGLKEIVLATAIAGLSIAIPIKRIYNEKYAPIDINQTYRWKEVNTHERKGGLWEFYMAENIPHIEENWADYQRLVRARNKGKEKGKILVPDLDFSGNVGE